MKKVDSRRNAHSFVIASGACTAWQSISKNADSREAYFASAKFMDRHADKSARDDRKMPSLRDTALAVAWQSISTPKVDSSMDRHADKSARDDDKKVDSRGNEQSNNSTPTKQAAVFCDDFASFQGAGAGILLGVNEQAHAAESSKSAQKANAKRSKL